MFLSSHILAEVEAVCDRVAILRTGRLVQVGTLDDLRHLNTHEVKVTFGGHPARPGPGGRGRAGDVVDGSSVATAPSGVQPGPLLAAIAGP